MKILSMVVPIYGVEKYIHKFLASLTPNLRSEVEVILVDDGSKDNCGEIIDEYAVLHRDTVNVIHKSNGGVSSARNAGLDIAKGEYIIFPDPDDYLDASFATTILEAIEQYKQPDVVLFDYYEVSKGSILKLHDISIFKEGYIDKNKLLEEDAENKYSFPSVWSKAVKRSLYEGLKFNEKMRTSEDVIMMADIFFKVKSAVYIHKGLYYYLVRHDSLSHTMNYEDEKLLFETRKYRYNKYSEIVKDIKMYNVINIAYGNLQRLYRNKIHLYSDMYEVFIKENIWKILCTSYFSLNTKKQCLFIYFGFARKYIEWKYKKQLK